MKTLLLSLITLLAMTGCSTSYPPLATVDKVDIERYSGKWFEIARYEHYFEKGCTNATAEYAIRKDGKIKVTNKCILEEGEPIDAVGIAYATDETNSRLKVSFFRPFYGNYWILMLDDDYSYAVIGDPSREYLWIISRTPTLDMSVKETILDALPELGYATDKLLWTKQQE
jgi:apolipoprotein D and lipocalin family protein